MTGSDDEATPAGWYRQTEDPANLRWWDGDDWTDDWMPMPPGFDRGPATEQPRASTLEPAKRAAVAAKAEPERAPRRSPRREPEPGLAPIRIEEVTTTATTKGPRRPQPGPDPAERRQLKPEARAAARKRPQGSHSAAARRATTSGAGGAALGREPGRRREGGTNVVQRGPKTVPPVGRVAVRALLIMAALGLCYFAFTKVRDAEPENARTLTAVADVIPPEDPDAPPIAEATLTLGDLPQGWSAQAHDPAADDICAGRVPASVIPPVEVARSGFTRGASGPFLVSVVSRFVDEHTAKRYFDLVTEVLDDCREYTVEGGAVHLGPLSFPRFGDETFAAQLSGDSGSGALSGHTVYLRVGDRVASIETVAFGDTGVDTELVELLARLVANRL